MNKLTMFLLKETVFIVVHTVKSKKYLNKELSVVVVCMEEAAIVAK